MEKTTLDAISDALSGIDGEVHYGVASKHPKGKPWNYTVFSRGGVDPKDNLTGYTERYEVAVVREGYVPEGAYLDVIEAMSAIPGMKLDRSAGIDYEYSVSSATNNVVEMMLVRFAKAVKA